MALTTDRISVLRGRPPVRAGGRRGLRTAHCWLVRSLGYGFGFIPFLLYVRDPLLEQTLTPPAARAAAPAEQRHHQQHGRHCDPLCAVARVPRVQPGQVALICGTAPGFALFPRTTRGRASSGGGYGAHRNRGGIPPFSRYDASPRALAGSGVNISDALAATLAAVSLVLVGASDLLICNKA